MVRHLERVLDGYERMVEIHQDHLSDQLFHSIETTHSGHSERTFSSLYGVPLNSEDSTTRRWQLSRLVATRFIGFLYILNELPLYGKDREKVLEELNHNNKRQRTNHQMNTTPSSSSSTTPSVLPSFQTILQSSFPTTTVPLQLNEENQVEDDYYYSSFYHDIHNDPEFVSPSPASLNHSSFTSSSSPPSSTSPHSTA